MKQREIKFRAFDDGKMFYSNDMKTDFEGDGDYNVLRQFFDFIREDAPLMQFTGLLDKNGKEIYEGDVIKITDPNSVYIGIVAFEEYSDGERYTTNDHLGWIINTERRNFSLPDATNDYQSEIIGNIYVTPELIPNLQCPPLKNGL